MTKPCKHGHEVRQKRPVVHDYCEKHDSYYCGCTVKQVCQCNTAEGQMVRRGVVVWGRWRKESGRL